MESRKLTEKEKANFFEAIRENRVDDFKRMVEENKDFLKILGPHGRNCFSEAAIYGNHVIMKYLHSINDNLCKVKDKYGDTALTSASKHRSKETVELLIKEFNADIHELGPYSRNCFQCAALGGKHDTMSFLHSIDENLCKVKDKYGDTALILASKHGSKETVELLIKEYNADISAGPAVGPKMPQKGPKTARSAENSNLH